MKTQRQQLNLKFKKDTRQIIKQMAERRNVSMTRYIEALVLKDARAELEK